MTFMWRMDCYCQEEASCAEVDLPAAQALDPRGGLRAAPDNAFAPVQTGGTPRDSAPEDIKSLALCTGRPAYLAQADTDARHDPGEWTWR